MKTAAQQIEVYKRDFEGMAIYQAALDRLNETPTEAYVKGKEYWQQREAGLTSARDAAKAAGWNGYYVFAWDPEVDGKLIERVEALTAAGIEVTRFWRKQKIMFKIPRESDSKPLDRVRLMNKILGAVGTDWKGVQFTNQGSIWW